MPCGFGMANTLLRLLVQTINSQERSGQHDCEDSIGTWHEASIRLSMALNADDSRSRMVIAERQWTILNVRSAEWSFRQLGGHWEMAASTHILSHLRFSWQYT